MLSRTCSALTNEFRVSPHAAPRRLVDRRASRYFRNALGPARPSPPVTQRRFRCCGAAQNGLSEPHNKFYSPSKRAAGHSLAARLYAGRGLYKKAAPLPKGTAKALRITLKAVFGSHHAPQPPGPGPHLTGVANEALHTHITGMQDTERSSVAERKERLDTAISEALQREAARHDAAVKNMQRLRALRLERDQKAKRK